MTIRNMLTAFLLLTSITFGQSDSRAGQSYAELVANTRLTFKLFRATAAKDPENNVLVAPVSFTLDFALLQNFAEKDARQEICSAFEFGAASAQDINNRSQALRKSLIYAPPSPPVRRRARRGELPPMGCAPAPEHLTLAGRYGRGHTRYSAPGFYI
jgi:hypothetical protein